MKNRPSAKRLLAVLALLAAPAAQAVSVVENDRDGSLTVSFTSGEPSLPQVEFQLFRVADISADARFTLAGDFAGYPVAVNGPDSAGWRALAQTLAVYAARDGLDPHAVRLTDGGGDAVFSPLEPGLYLVTNEQHVGDTLYTFQPFLVSLPAADEESGGWLYEVQAVGKFSLLDLSVPEPVSRSVRKVWQDDDSHRPASVEVQLLQNGAVCDTVTLSEANRWSHTWDGLDPAARWQIAEKQTAPGYTVTTEQSGDLFVVTNTAPTPRTPEGDEPESGPSESPAPPAPTPAAPGQPTLPQTGALWWPVPLLACGGLFLLLIGWWRRRNAGR